MTPKQYLIVSRAFYPNNSPRGNRTTELVKELCRQGHSVHLVCPAHTSQGPLIRDFGFKIIDMGRLWPKIPIIWGARKSWPLRILRRGMQQLFEYPDIQLKGRVNRLLKGLGNYDVLISIAVPHPIHWGVASALKKNPSIAKVWLADCGDPFMGLESDSFKKMRYFGFFERNFCDRADFITVPTEQSKEGYYSEYRDRLRVIPQGFKFADYTFLENLQPQKDGVIRFAYAGLFIPGQRDPRPFLDFITKKKIDFEFHVFTKDDQLIRPYMKEDGRIKSHGFIDRFSLLRKLTQMDFLLNFEYLTNNQTPSKLIDYWLCKRPILNLRSDEIHPKAIDQFLQGQYQEALTIENPERYEIGNVVRQFDRLAEEVLATKNAGEGSL